jgi:hypothetical protein
MHTGGFFMSEPNNVPKRKWNTKQKRIAVAVITLLVVCFLRETGLLTLSLYTSRSSSSMGSTALKTSTGKGASKGSGTSVVVQVSRPVQYSIEAKGDPVAGKTIRQLLEEQAGGGNPLLVKVTVTDLTIRGLYWLPLYKTGTCRFSATMSGTTASAEQYKGTMSGTTDLNVIGFCSAYHFRQILGKDIGQKISKEVSKQVAQESS